MSTPIEGGRALLRGRVFGFPVQLDLSFVVIMALLGFSPQVRATDFLLWLAITPVAVLLHELGHAFAARAGGASPQIALAGFGGVTTFVPPQPLSRWRSLGISLAGPGVGLAIGVALVVVQRATVDAVDPFGWVATALRLGVWTSLGWSVLNLLPVLPLDGGQAMRELLPGDPEQRERRAAGVSLVVASLAALAALTVLGQVFLAAFLVFFAVGNALALRRPAAGQPDPGAASAATPEQELAQLLWQGRPDLALQVLRSLPPGTPVDLALHGAVLALTSDREQGLALLDQERRRRPEDPNPVALLALTLTVARDWDGVEALFTGPEAHRVPAALRERAVAEAQDAGRADVVERLTAVEGSAHPDGT